MLRYSVLFAVLVVTPAQGQPRRVWNDFPYGVDCMAFSPDGKLLATGTNPSRGGKDAVRLWDVHSGKEIGCLEADYPFGCASLAFTPDGRALVTNGGGRDNAILIWEVPSRKLRQTIKPGPGVVGGLSLSRDGKLLAATTRDGTAVLLDLETGKEVRRLSGHVSARQLIFAPDGKILATSAGLGPVVLWNVASGKELFALSGHRWHVVGMAFAPDGKTMYTLGSDKLLVYWDPSTGKEQRVVDLKKQNSRHNMRLMALSPDGGTMAIWGSDGIRLFDVKEGTYYKGPGWDYQWGRPLCVSFSPTGRLLATSSDGGTNRCTVYLWNVPDPKKKQQ